MGFENLPSRRRIYVNEDLRANPERFLMSSDQLPVPTIIAPDQGFIPVHTFFTIMERERNSLHIPVSRHSLNVAQFVAVVSALTEGVELKRQETELPRHFLNFQELHKQRRELSLVTFDMDDLTSTNTMYTHLHGSIICSTLERTIIEIIEKYGGLLASMGEENMVALPDNLENANIIAQLILREFTSIPFDFGAGEFHQGVSAGVASLSHSKPPTFRRLMELTGGALVYSKKNGKGFATIFGDQ